MKDETSTTNYRNWVAILAAGELADNGVSALVNAALGYVAIPLIGTAAWGTGKIVNLTVCTGLAGVQVVCTGAKVLGSAVLNAVSSSNNNP